MIYQAPTNPRPVVYSDSATLYGRHFTIESLIVQSGANKTFTLPTACRELAGKPTWFVHNGTGTLTLSGAFPTGSSHVMDTKSTLMVVCLPVTSSTYKWHGIGSGGIASGITEGITDLVGSMFTSTPTMTGITATFQDSTNDIDLAVAYASSGITTTAADSTSVVGSANTAARGDHQHGIGTHTHADGTHGGTLANAALTDATATPGAAKIPISDGSNHLDGWISTATAATPGLVEHQNWGDYVPTWTFGTADPTTNVVKVGRYMQVGNMVTFYCSFSADDGNDGTLTSVTLPVAPTDTNTLIPIRGQQLVNTTWTDPLGYIDATTSPYPLAVHTATVCTNAQACAYYFSGSYEVAAT
jgi:hypothetical protein